MPTGQRLMRNGSAEAPQQSKHVLSRTKEQLATTESIFVRMLKLRKTFPWPDDRSISELVVTGESIRRVASEAQSALTQERQARKVQSESLKRKEQLDKQLGALAQRIKRFEAAQAVLNKIREEHSLNTAMRSTIELNRAAIESIFSSIHVPAEFSGLGKSLATLIRKTDGSKAKLTEISTGQRAAFGLSLFLAQNSRLTEAPSVILIDDPIAHVDDFNSLSFLDYLREIAIMGDRQIFFATANDKIATLFERKFDCLGDNSFRRFNLSRK
jgi:DNA repair protein SbcC/Rad50